MTNQDSVTMYLRKAAESLEGAESEFAERRFQNASNRAYYSCYQAAVAALIASGIKPSGPKWHHRTVQATFTRELVNRRKRYPSELSRMFEPPIALRNTADYQSKSVSEAQAARSVGKARLFVLSVQTKEGDSQ